MYNSEYYQETGSSTTEGSLLLPIRSENETICNLNNHDFSSYSWMAPESYFDATWDLRSDVWMFGVLLWGLLRSQLSLSCCSMRR